MVNEIMFNLTMFKRHRAYAEAASWLGSATADGEAEIGSRTGGLRIGRTSA
jgi:hypothetical protein